MKELETLECLYPQLELCVFGRARGNEQESCSFVLSEIVLLACLFEELLNMCEKLYVDLLSFFLGIVWVKIQEYFFKNLTELVLEYFFEEQLKLFGECTD